jgi:D-glycero-D-manno-heptose 1,7-bisphosphate phosphatase
LSIVDCQLSTAYPIHRGLFLDRDNTLIVCNGYLGDPSQVRLIDGAAAAVARAKRLGFVVVTVSNQSGVARGLFDEAAVRAVNTALDAALLTIDPNAVIDRHEFCPFHPQAPLERFRIDSPLRKPQPGMILLAAREMNIDLRSSWLIGDTPRDIGAARAAGCRSILFVPPRVAPSPSVVEEGPEADFTVDSLASALDIIEQSAG